MARTGAGELPDLPDDDSQNAKIYAETKDWSAAEVKGDAAGSWMALRAAIDACSEEDLEKPHPRYPENLVWEALPGAAGHLGAHLMSWFMDDGDQERAEAIARWGYDFECSFLPEGAKRADASYNLACFYARAGRLDDALPLLQDSVRWSSDLARWARQDPDLAGVREDPRIRELLA